MTAAIQDNDHSAGTKYEQDRMKVAVVGASGIVGRALLEHLTSMNIDCVGLSRRAPDLATTHIAIDLLDADATRTIVLSQLLDVTHVVYAALFEMPGLIAGWQAEEQMQTNRLMLDNLLTPLAAGNLQHISLLQGTKAYGAHVAPMQVPGRERNPRHPHKNFYWLQEDLLVEAASQNHWQYTIWRPQIIFGHALGAPMNLLAAIGVYAALLKQAGQPLHYPGGPAMVTEAIDADLLASALTFAMTEPRCAGETYNITNGDVFTLNNVWPVIAECFAMQTGEPRPQVLSHSLYNNEARWATVVDQHQLQPHSLRTLVGDSFYYADALLNTAGTTSPPPALLSTIKLRQAGFHGCIDTEDMFRKWFGKLQALRILPT